MREGGYQALLLAPCDAILGSCLLHGHTYAVGLAARLLSNGMLKPKPLLRKLQEEKEVMDADDKIRSTKPIVRKNTIFPWPNTRSSVKRENALIKTSFGRSG